MLQWAVQRVRAFPANLRDILVTPGTLVLFIIWLCLLLYATTTWMLLVFFGPAILYFGLLGYMTLVDRKEGFRLGLIRGSLVTGISGMVLAASVFGYCYTYVNDIDVARIPTDILVKNQWDRDPLQDRHEQFVYGLVRLETRGHRYDDRVLAEPPYPGEVWLVTLKTVFIPSQDQIREQVTRKIETLKVDGLTIDTASKSEGRHDLKGGREARWIEWDAVLKAAPAGAFYDFVEGAKIKVRVEYWPCPEHGTAIIFVGAAQYGTTLSKGRIRDIIVGPLPDDLQTYDSILRLAYNAQCA